MGEIKIVRDVGIITSKSMTGFFQGWNNPPSELTLHQLLVSAPQKSIAIEMSSKKIIGFTYAISDLLLSAYVPLLEVLPEWRSQGLGSRLVEDLLDQLKDYYMIDVSCDAELSRFYEKLGFEKAGAGMIKRNYKMQSGRLFK